jgi:hypothetical protein
MVKQSVELLSELQKNFKTKFPNDLEAYVVYTSKLRAMNYKELIKEAKTEGVKVPCPAKY